MTDTNGSATALQPDAGTPAAANGGNGEGSPGAAADPFTGLEAGTREWLGTAGIKDVASLAAKARNAESLIGKSVQLPGADAKPEDWDKFFGRIGRPEKPEGYEFKLPEGVPEDMPYDKGFAEKFRPVGHQLGLTARQAAGVHDFYVKAVAEQFQAQADAVVTQVAEATKALETAYGGAKGSAEFQAELGYATRFVNEFGGEALLKGLSEAGLIGDGGVVLNPAVAIAFAKAGKALFAEDGFEKGEGAGVGADNPFKDGPGKGNQTIQMQMVHRDRAGAIRMIRAAGHDPEAFGVKTAAT